VLLLVTLAMVGIIAIVGLALDVGLVFITDARLRRSVDSAALAAAQQVRAGFTIPSLNLAAEEYLNLNGLDTSSVVVSVCDPNNYDASNPLCTDPPRKLVQVQASASAHLAFLPVIPGMPNAVTVTASAVSETASMDVVLLIDRSESMAWGPDPDHKLPLTNPLRDPDYCNSNSDGTNLGSCEPFNHVINAAVSFVGKLYFPYDRVAIITFDKTVTQVMTFDDNCPTAPCTASSIKSRIDDRLIHLTVFEGDTSYDTAGMTPPGHNAIYPDGNPSRGYGDDNMQPPVYSPDSNYKSFQCPLWDNPPTPADKTTEQCTTTNTGGGLQLAGKQFAGSQMRANALWVVILLTDGVANAGYATDGSGAVTGYFCPADLQNPSDFGAHPLCNDGVATTRHANGDSEYDAEDYAYDGADFVGKPYPAGQGALIYSIGLGPAVNDYPQPDGVGLGTKFLKYAAETVGNGKYYPAPNAGQLTDIFRQIAENLATRLTK